MADSSEIRLILKEQASSFGSRAAGTPLRTKLKNLIALSERQRILIDFVDLPLISSGFADEVFGKLFVELGPVKFTQSIVFRNLAGTVRQIIDRAIAQRNASGL